MTAGGFLVLGAALILALLLAGALAGTVGAGLRHITVFAWQVGLVYRDGVFERELPPGRHRLLVPARRRTLAVVTTAPQQTALGQLEVVSRDQFSFRIALALTWRVTDPRAYYEAGAAEGAFMPALPAYMPTPASARMTTAAAAAALAAAAVEDLDALLASPATLAATVAASLGETLTGIVVEAGVVTRLQLPPETRRMLTEAERARRDGLAALERARGEQASLRALANAARLVRDNPELAQLRLLQAVQASKGATTIVVGDTARSAAIPPA